MGMTGCKKKDTTPVVPASYNQTNLVADTAGFSAGRTDVSLKNAWGIAIGPTGIFWISSNHTGSTAVYDYNGAQIKAAVNIPLNANPTGASPTGVVLNTTTDFVIPGNNTSLFIYATEDGLLSAWNSTTAGTTMTVADRSSAGAVYKGLTIGSDGGSNFIYATDFHNGKIDVFDKNFAYVSTKPFSDPAIPTGFAPFNIQNIGGQLYVTYAKQMAPDNHDDQSGAGNGYIDVFTTSGTLVKRFASQGMLNSPWGIVQAPAGFGQGSNMILVGNFGDGRISVYQSDGTYVGQLMKNSVVISIPGLWAITFDSIAPADPNVLYFTAGPNEESHGLFGYLKKM